MKEENKINKEDKISLTNLVKKAWTEIPRGKVTDLPMNFGRSFLISANTIVDGILTAGGQLAPIDGEDTKKLKERNIMSKYGVVGNVLGYATTSTVAGYVVYNAAIIMS